MPVFRRIYIATSGPTGNGPDPALDVQGVHWARLAHKHLPRDVASVHLGHGRRHGDLRDYLGLGHHRTQRYSTIWGAPTSVANYEECVPGSPTVLHRATSILASGQELRNGLDESFLDTASAMQRKIRSVPHHSVVVADWNVFDVIDPNGVVDRKWGLYDLIVTPFGFFTFRPLT